MAIFDNSLEFPGHDVTLRQLDEIIEEYQKACYATGKRVDQPHLRETARRAIQALTPFYSESDADKLLERAVSKPRLGVPQKLSSP
jgi:hypothetical protein